MPSQARLEAVRLMSAKAAALFQDPKPKVKPTAIDAVKVSRELYSYPDIF